jgi:hypothetical protein
MAKNVKSVPFTDPFKIFIVAEHFHLTGHIIGKRIGESMGFATNNVVLHLGNTLTMNMALALELYFKCVRCIESQVIEYEHNLLWLFNNITQNHRDRIENHFKEITTTWDFSIKIADFYKSKGIPHEYNLTKTIEHAADAFISCRYMFEKPQFEVYGGLNEPIMAVRRLIYEYHPDFPLLAGEK